MSLPGFLRENRAFLGAGFLLMFASSFGQTFFIALSGPAIRAEFGLSHGAWGAIYSAGTLSSAALLSAVGGLSDRHRARLLAGWVMAAYAAICLGMAVAGHWAALIALIFGLRFCGQGMMTQIATTALARWFHARRGRAVAIAALGVSVGAALLPALAARCAALWGWRAQWIMAAAAVILLGLILQTLLRLERAPQSLEAERAQTGMGGRVWSRAQAVRHWSFWLLTPGLIVPPVLGTALFFQIAALGGERVWGADSPALLLPAAALATLLSNLCFSGFTDRFGARALLPFYQLPLALGVLALLPLEGRMAGIVAFIGLGITDGMAISILGAIWPEVYGSTHIGAIRGLAIASMVLGTAIAPGVTGALMDQGVALSAQFAALGAASLLVCLIFALTAHRLR